MGMNYPDLSTFGRSRKMERLGPSSMFTKLVHTWTHLTRLQVAEKIKLFWRMNGIKRFKSTTLTPPYHAEGCSPDDNHFELGPSLRKLDDTGSKMSN